MERAKQRVLRFMRGGSARVRPAASGNAVLLETETGRSLATSPAVLAALAREAAVEPVLGGIRIAERRGDPLGARAREVERLPGDGKDEAAGINHAESPLGALMRRRTKGGKPFLTQEEFGAGERLRADFTRGQLSPRLGANWIASVSSGRRGGGVAELTDAALAARLRVEKAVLGVGPELSGVLLDACCFLKGLEQIEAERGWPVRSAKIVLKSALGVLARHYSPMQRPSREPVLHWGAEDYRPRLSAAPE